MSVFVTLGYSQLLATFLCSLLGDVENSIFNYDQSHPACYSSILVHSCPANLDMTKIINRKIKSAFACYMFSTAAAEQKKNQHQTEEVTFTDSPVPEED